MVTKHPHLNNENRSEGVVVCAPRMARQKQSPFPVMFKFIIAFTTFGTGADSRPTHYV